MIKPNFNWEITLAAYLNTRVNKVVGLVSLLCHYNKQKKGLINDLNLEKY